MKRWMPYLNLLTLALTCFIGGALLLTAIQSARANMYGECAAYEDFTGGHYNDPSMEWRYSGTDCATLYASQSSGTPLGCCLYVRYNGYLNGVYIGISETLVSYTEGASCSNDGTNGTCVTTTGGGGGS